MQLFLAWFVTFSRTHSEWNERALFRVMASKLWNYKNCRSSSSRPNSSLTKSSASDRAYTPTPPNMTASEIDMEELKSQISFHRVGLWTTVLSKVLKLDKEVLVECWYRSSRPLTPGGKLQVTVAKLHYYQDCVEVLRRVRSQALLRFNGVSIAIFPDYTASISKAWAAFMDVMLYMSVTVELFTITCRFMYCHIGFWCIVFCLKFMGCSIVLFYPP